MEATAKKSQRAAVALQTAIRADWSGPKAKEITIAAHVIN
jgi:hypothetical protein